MKYCCGLEVRPMQEWTQKGITKRDREQMMDLHHFW
jgi:hypothetical protein